VATALRKPMRQTTAIKLLIAASLFAPALIFGLVAWQTYRDEFRSAEATAQHVSSLVEEHALKTFETIALALKFTDQRIKGLSWDEIAHSEALWNELNEVQHTLEQADSLFVIGPHGDLMLTTRAYPSPPTDFSDRDYFDAQLGANQGLYVGKSYIGRISQRPIFNLSIRRSGADGEFNGVIGSSAYVSYFEHFFETVGLPQNEFSVALVRNDGEVLVEYPVNNAPRRIDLGEFRANDTDNPRGLRDGSDRLVIAKQMRGFPVHVVYSIDKATLMNNWYERLVGWGVLTVGMAGALFAVSWIALRRAKAEQAALSKLEDQVRQREEAQEKLRHAQKMEALGQLTGGVAHDFNNLLQVIISGAYSLRRTADAKSLPAVELIRHAAQRSAHLTRQLLSFSRRHQLNPEPTDLRRKILQVAPIVDRSLRGDIQMKFAIGDDVWPVEIDPVDFEMALINIGANARDAMPNGGVFEISLRNVQLTGHETGEKLAGDHVEVTVRDSGTGMSKEVMDHVFEPFFTTKEVNRGTGLGLSQVYGFARQSGGAVTLDSAENQGTRITLYLPRSHKAPIDLPLPAEMVVPEVSVDRILMVEDNAEVAQTGAEMLRDLGYAVDVVESGKAALDALADPTKRFDLVFSDIVMPGGMNGHELKAEALRRHPMLPFVLTTGYSRDASFINQTQAKIVQKPYEPHTLKRTIDEALSRSAS
jgi:two-component system NtrC family sensor kinase